MANKTDEIHWVYADCTTISQYDGLEDIIMDLNEMLKAQKAGKWRGLGIDIAEGFDGDHSIVIRGERPEDPIEKANRLRGIKIAEEHDKKEYERLKKKFRE